MQTLKQPAISPPVAPKRVFDLTRSLSALRHRNFRLFWSGQMISLIGTWMQSTGQAWLVLQLTKSGWALGIVGALQFLPVLCFALFGGVLADRLPKRRMLLITQSAAAILAFTLWLLVFTNTVQLWQVFIFAALLGLCNAFDMPTRQSFVMEMVGREDLSNAVALNSSIFNMARLVGPGIAGLMIAWIGEAPLFFLNSISYIPVIIGLALINAKQLHSPRPRPQAQVQSTFASLHEGFSYIKRTHVVLMIIIVIGTISLFGINFNVTLPLISTEVLKLDAKGFGFISSAFGGGALLASLILALGGKSPGIKQMLFSAILFGICESLFALSPWYWLSLLLVAMVGFTQVSFSAVANATLQVVTPDHLRGRIMSVYMLVFAGSVPLGNLFTGWLDHSYNASIAVLVGAVLSLAAALAGWFLRAPAEKSMRQAIL
jgi:MFS family permease